MKFAKKTVYPGGRKEKLPIHVFTPANSAPGRQIAPVLCNGEVIVLAGGGAYSFLAKALYCAALPQGADEGEKGCVMAIPCPFAFKPQLAAYYPNIQEHYKGIILYNTKQAGLSAQEILQAVETAEKQKGTLCRAEPAPPSNGGRWETNNTLTVKREGGWVFISGAPAIFKEIAKMCEDFSQYGDGADINQCPPHWHFDSEENTAGSDGLTLCYWEVEKEAEETGNLQQAFP